MWQKIVKVFKKMEVALIEHARKDTEKNAGTTEEETVSEEKSVSINIKQRTSS